MLQPGEIDNMSMTLANPSARVRGCGLTFSEALALAHERTSEYCCLPVTVAFDADSRAWTLISPTGARVRDSHVHATILPVRWFER